MAKYRCKFVIVDAIQYKGNGNMKGTVPNWIWLAFEQGILKATNGTDPLVVHTPEGDIVVSAGDWIIKDAASDIRACSADIFARTYELIE